MTAIVPTLGDLLSSKPGVKFRVDDERVTTRCPRSSCFQFQRLSNAVVVGCHDRLTYQCRSCAAAMVVVGPETAECDLPLSEVIGNFRYWTGPSGVHLRLASSTRVQSKGYDREDYL